MSNKTKFAEALSRFGIWVKNQTEEIKKAWSYSREYGSERREERRERFRMRRSIFGRTLLGMAIFTALYWGTLVMILNVNVLYYELYYIAGDILSVFGINLNSTNAPVFILMAYMVIMILWSLIAVYRASAYLDRVYTAADSITDRKSDMPYLPSRLSYMDTKLRNIRFSIIQNEQAAKEAEQRKNDLVVYLAHDLKTPLSSVIGYLTLLEEAPDIPTEQRAKYTSITLDKAYRLEQLINEFFDITRFNLQSVELEHNRIDLSIMLMQIADEFYPVLEEKNLNIRLEVPKQLMMTGDADKLSRVFDNLIRNAVSYSYENTEITIAARAFEGRAEIVCRNKGDMIPPQSLDRLFEKFFRADSARHSGSGGSGLGLAIAKHIVELHGGRIKAVSTKEYTEFYVALPLEM